MLGNVSIGMTVDGGAGDDNIQTGGGNDSVIGGDGNDMLEGGADTDTLDGGEGTNQLFEDTSTTGGRGSDRTPSGSGRRPRR